MRVKAWFAIGTIALVAPAAAEDELTGRDYVAWPPEKRMAWALSSAQRMVAVGLADDVITYAAGLIRCMNEVTTARNARERLTVEAFRSSPLSETATLCLLSIKAGKR